jgi:hypothetical protein
MPGLGRASSTKARVGSSSLEGSPASIYRSSWLFISKVYK